MAGVSRTTVSFVLNRLEGVSISESTRQRVLEAASNSITIPNSAGRKLVSGKSDTLGLVLYQSPEQVFADAFLPQVILGVEQAAMQQKFHVLLKPVEPGDPEGYSRLINENHVDGIILSGPRQDDNEIIRLHQDGVPVMLLGQLPDTDLPFVDVNAISGCRDSRKPSYRIGASANWDDYQRAAFVYLCPAAQARLPARRCRRAGLRVRMNGLIKEGNYTPASGYHAMLEL